MNACLFVIITLKFYLIILGEKRLRKTETKERLKNDAAVERNQW
jgi:hypothetical protein